MHKFLVLLSLSVLPHEHVWRRSQRWPSFETSSPPALLVFVLSHPGQCEHGQDHPLPRQLLPVCPPRCPGPVYAGPDFEKPSLLLPHQLYIGILRDSLYFSYSQVRSHITQMNERCTHRALLCQKSVRCPQKIPSGSLDFVPQGSRWV